jgi:hypothetical protein
MARRPSSLLLLIVAVVVVGVIWYRVTPRRAYDEFTRGIAAADAERLNRTVDFSRLREHLREDLAGAVSAAMQQQRHPSQAATTSVLDTVVAEATTIPGLVRIVASLTAPPASATPGDTTAVPVSITYHYRNPLRVDVRVQYAGQPDDAAPNFTFELRGPRWRLTHLWTGRMLGNQKSS